MKALVTSKNCWPNSMMKFCTEELKIRPTHAWLQEHDTEGNAVMVCGVRREESPRRRLWPEWVESSEKNEGRADWSPLVAHTTEERDELIRRAGYEPLPHRSRECRCVLANAKDLSTWSENDLSDIETIETAIHREPDPLGNQFMFRPNVRKGNPRGIRAVVQWAKALTDSREEAREEQVGCDSGYCGG